MNISDNKKSTTVNNQYPYRKLFLLIILNILIVRTYAQSPLCESFPTSFCCEYVSEISINGVKRAGAPDATGFSSGPGYFDYTNTSMTTLEAGKTYPATVTVKTNSTYQEYVKIWFDFNGNGSLQDAGELVFDQVNTFSGTYVYSGNITVPQNAFNGDIYIRVVMVYANTPALCGTYSFGTTIDLKATITGGITSYTLNAAIAGSGGYSGNVTSSPSGINTDLGLNSANYAEGSVVTLTAAPIGAATFTGWTGDVSSTENPLTVTMDGTQNITGNFGPPNSPPAVNNDGPFAVNTGETVSGNLLNNDNDPDGDNIFITAQPPLLHGTFDSFNLTTGEFEYKAPTDWTGTFTFNYTVTDGIESVQGTVAISVTDNIPPEVVISNVEVGLDGSGNAVISPNDINNGSSDNIGITGFTLDKTAFSCNDLGNNTVTLTATDAAGNIAEATVVVKVIDNINPALIAEDQYLLKAPADKCTAVADYRFYTEDNCDMNGNLAFNGNASNGLLGWNDTGAPYGDGWKASNGWFITSWYRINKHQVIDLLAQGYDAATLDASPEITVSEDYVGIAPKRYDDIYFLNVELRDASGNKINEFHSGDLVCSQNIQTVSHSFKNYGEGVRYIFIEHGGDDSEGWAGHYGAKMGNLQVHVDAPHITPNLPVHQTAGIKLADEFPVGTTQNAYQVIDYAGNISTAAFDVIVEDDTPPVIVTKDITVQLDENGEATIAPADVDDGSYDPCGIQSRTLNINQFDCSDVNHPVTVTLTVTDIYGNSASETAVVTVEDIAPVVVTKNMTVQLDENGIAEIAPEDIDAGSSDACGIQSRLLDITSFSCSDVGNPVTVTLTVTDVNSNSASETATVIIQDNISPNVVTKDILVQLDENGEATIVPADVDNGSSDACGIQNKKLNITSFSCSDVGNPVTVTLTVTDVNGNYANETAVVTVEDNFAPVVVTKNITVQLDENGAATITPAAIDDGSSDACGIQSRSLDITSFSCSDVGNPVTAMLTVTDINGNSAEKAAVVTVADNILPTVVTQDIGIELDATGNALIAESDIDNGSFDNCGIEILSLSKTAFSCEDLGENSVELTVTDINGNSNTSTAVVTVNDTTAPVVDVRPITIYLEKDGTYTLNRHNIETLTKAGAEEGGTSDNCTTYSELEIKVSREHFTCEDAGTHVPVTVSVTDGSGNTTTKETSIWVIDRFTPVVLCKDTTLYLSADGAAQLSATDLEVKITDACGIDRIWTDKSSFNCSDLGENQVTLFAMDTHNNWASCISNITVADTLPPVVESVSDIIVKVTGGINETLINYPDITAEDNCSVQIEQVEGLGPKGLFPLGSTTERWLITDAAGNETYIAFTVTVSSENSSPVVIHPVADQWLVASHKYKIPLIMNEVFKDDDGDGLNMEIFPVNKDIVLSWLEFKNDSLHFSPLDGDAGCENLVIRVTDPSGAFAADTFSVCIENKLVGAEITEAEDLNVEVYPNPAHDKVTVKLLPAGIYAVKLSMIDMNGKVIKIQRYNTGENISIDVSDKAPGMYLIKMEINERQIIKKLIVKPE